MNRGEYRQLCADPRQFDFGRLPLLLPTPRQGRSWTIRWRQTDGALVLPGETLLRLTGDSDGEQRDMCAPAAGRLRVLVPDSRFVASFRPAGVLEYGIRFTPPPLPAGEARELRQLRERRQTRAAEARRRQAQQRERQDKQERLRALERQITAAEAVAAAAAGSHADAIAAVPTLRRALRARLLTLLQSPSAGQSPDIPFPVLWQALTLSAQLPVPATASVPALPDAGLTARFFRWLLPRVTAVSPGLPEALRRHREECWEEIADAFLPPQPRGGGTGGG